ncbi:hypothetical protein [Hippea maritima]|uniref:Type 4 fimbrial biogenesis protein PilX N-terminal domain-containing protein n=1 Tax=Hippea maritima (strain ATCC 700847 / DSM 10411 / MH2) TaxID=760142 RepID=F2LWJ3_HIPMA|nr:hypothetical protein [Hippea maritima]AEA34102.1 hypothetical protein Hipma_1136 [Hippea maritima DSM 10411]
MFLNKKGSLIFIVFLLILFAFVGAMIVSLLSSSSVSSSEDLISSQAFYLAESGKEIAIERCVNEGFCDNATYTLDNGEMVVVFVSNASITIDNGSNSILYESTSEGKLEDTKRKIEFKFWK